jgi:uncharacterized protein YlaI
MGANQNSSRNLAYIPKSPQIQSTESRRAVERKIDNRTHSVKRLGEKPVFKRRAHDCKTRGETVTSTASGSANVTMSGHTRNEHEGTRPGSLLREAPRNPTAWKTGQCSASTGVSWRDSQKPRTGDEPRRTK